MSRLIDAYVLIEILKEEKKRDRSKVYGEHECDLIMGTISMCIDYVKATPTAFDTEKVVEQLEEKTDFLKGCVKYGNRDDEQQEKSYSTMIMYEVADLVEDLIDIVKKGGVE